MITHNEEANLRRTLASVAWADEIVIVDSGSSDRTEEIARDCNARFYTEPWKGFGAQKNSALDKCNSDWVLSLDADEVVTPELAASMQRVLSSAPEEQAWFVARRNLFLGRAMLHGGFYPDRKLRLIRNNPAFRFETRSVHETIPYTGPAGTLEGDLIHPAYPSLASYIEHMDRYSSLGAGMLADRRAAGVFGFVTGTVLNPAATFIYNYLLRAGFLDGREGLLLHLYHSCYVSWKYAKAWELAKRQLPRR